MDTHRNEKENGPLELQPETVHVWRLKTSDVTTYTMQFERLLTPDEISRSYGFATENLRSHYVVAKAATRLLLARYLRAAPETIRFGYTPHDKPFLLANTNLHFNLSHSEGLILVALTRGCEIGVDVERVQPFPELQDVAYRFFSSEEVAKLGKLPDNQRLRRFFTLWTRKEAYLKALGIGLSARHPQRETDSKWTWHEIETGLAHAGAVAYPGSPRQLVVMPPVSDVHLLV